ncbi:hypothetical protein [Cohnella sp. AR92]|uniref:hypothetical protein n=1 Tax=Cohnella sp. AR92 TaxID=648716 RepID=UPI000F8DF7CD|nr:hypothetical protein [Cohnella sp. AR92]RUS47714.1 hypothetical protein ELR57_07990 [Cohnella sp. AR92]
MTKEQLATFLIRGLGVDSKAQPTAGTPDGTVSDWAKGYVALSLELKLLSNGSDGKFGGQANATRDLLLTGAYETAKLSEANKPLNVLGADFTEGNTLKLTLSAAIDENSVDLSKILVNGVPLDPSKDSFTLPEDKKGLIIKLHDGFTIDLAKQPTIGVEGLKTIFGNEVKNDAEKPFTVTVTAPPAGSTSSAAASSGSSAPPSSSESVPPVLLYPNGIEEGHAYYNVFGTSAGTVYYALFKDNGSAPSKNQIKTGSGSLFKGNKMLTPDEQFVASIDVPTADLEPGFYLLYTVFRSENGAYSDISSASLVIQDEGEIIPPDPIDEGGAGNGGGPEEDGGSNEEDSGAGGEDTGLTP